jgi:hypothetical protein
MLDGALQIADTPAPGENCAAATLDTRMRTSLLTTGGKRTILGAPPPRPAAAVAESGVDGGWKGWYVVGLSPETAADRSKERSSEKPPLTERRKSSRLKALQE